MVDDAAKTIQLSDFELREVVRYAAACARAALVIFEGERLEDRRPRAAIEAAEAFANGAKRSKLMRDSAWAAHRAAQEARGAGFAALSEAARAASAAAAAAFLHPIPRSTQVKHILGAAAHAARAFELNAGGTAASDSERIEDAKARISAVVVRVLERYPPAPAAGGRVGELMRQLDTALRSSGRVSPNVCGNVRDGSSHDIRT